MGTAHPQAGQDEACACFSSFAVPLGCFAGRAEGPAAAPQTGHVGLGGWPEGPAHP